MVLMRWPVVLVLSTIVLINEISKWIVSYLLFSQTRGRPAALLLQAHDLSLQHVDRTPTNLRGMRFALPLASASESCMSWCDGTRPISTEERPYRAGQMKTAFRRQHHGASHKLWR
jgi:hypothetical protein